MISYYFISGLPRSGSTLLSSILKQNVQFDAGISSPLYYMAKNFRDVITNSEYNHSVDDEKRKKVLHGIFDSYYYDANKSTIFDTNREWTKETSLLKQLFPYTKILSPVRDIVSILNSFEVIFSKNPFHTNTMLRNNISVFARCDELIDSERGVVSRPWMGLREAYFSNPDMIKFVEYEKLCKNPEETMRSIYEFLEKPYYQHDFENVEYSDEIFDQQCNLKNLHTVRRKLEYSSPRCVLPPEIVRKYSEMNMEFWKNLNNN